MPRAPMPKPPAMPPPPTRQQLALEIDRLDKARRAALKLDIFQGDVTRRASNWKIAVGLIGSAYKTADTHYRDTLQKQTASDALEIQIFFSVLTVATSGALGWVSYAAAQAKGGIESALRDAVESGIQATAGEVFSANGPLLFPPSGDGTVSLDPQVFQNKMEKKVEDVFMAMLLAFGKIRQTYLDLPLEAWDNYDEKKEKADHAEWQKEADQLADKDDLPSVEWMAKELERGRWAKYVLDNHSYRDFGVFQTADTPDDVGSAVRSRLEELGVSQAATPPPPHSGRGATAGLPKATIARVWDWAQNYKVRKFTDEKKNPKGGGPDHQ
jgi:hypothetical protein